MNKFYILIIIIILFITGCSNKLITLDNNLYDSCEFITITADEVNNLDDNNYIIYTYNSYCNFSRPCDEVFQEFMNTYNIAIYSISFEDFKDTYLYDTVKYAPSVIIVSDGEVISYLDANSDDDLAKYQDVDEFNSWLLNYINPNN